MDEHDRSLREGMGILQLLLMKHSPESLAGQWSPILKLVSQSSHVSAGVVDWILKSYHKKDLLEETGVFLQQHLAHFTPSTV